MVLAVLGVTGCQASDPVIHGGPTTPPGEFSPTPQQVLPNQQVVLGHEVTLAALAADAHAAAGTLEFTSTQTALVRSLAAGHETHVIALLDPQPARRSMISPAPAPRPTPAVPLTAIDGAAATAQLQEQLATALRDYRLAATADQGPRALVWGSLAAYARAADAALRQDSPRADPPTVQVRELEPWSDAEAEQQALRQVHALIYGYQAAIPWLASEESPLARELVAERRGLRDQLAQLLRQRGVAVPAAEPAYELSTQPVDSATATALLQQMEASFAPFAGAWLAAATSTEARHTALRHLERSAGLHVEWGGSLTVWPGWPG